MLSVGLLSLSAANSIDFDSVGEEGFLAFQSLCVDYARAKAYTLDR